jgi:hypothetical protein
MRRRLLIGLALVVVLFCVVAVRTYGWRGSPNGGVTLNLPGMSQPVGGLELWPSVSTFDCATVGC